jgi:hypothetical protein
MTFFKLQGKASEIRFEITVDAFGVWQPIPQSSVLPQRRTEQSDLRDVVIVVMKFWSTPTSRNARAARGWDLSFRKTSLSA